MSCRRNHIYKLTLFFILATIVLCFLWSKEKTRRIEMERRQRAEHFNNGFRVINSKDFETFLLVLVVTGPQNHDRRDAIRKTWLADSIAMRKKNAAVKTQDIMHFFVLGTAGLDAEQLNSIKEEQSMHKDLLLLEGFKDAYEKLTEKLGTMLMWVRDHITFKYVLKGDDDTFARVEILRKELNDRYTRYPGEKLYYGYFYGKGNVKKSGPWKETEWKLCDLYIPYARGGGYILSSNVVDYVANNFHLFKRYLSEDVSLGSWLAPLDVRRIHDKRFDTEYKSRGCSNTFLVSHKQTTEDMFLKHDSLKSTGKLCKEEFSSFPGYEYNWDVPPSQCCIRSKGVP